LQQTKEEVMEDIKKEFEGKFCHQMMNLDGSNKHYVIDPIVIDSPQFIIDWIEQKIKGVITEYKSKLVEGQSSGEWQSILLVNALRLLNDKEKNELALSIIERTTPNLLDEAKEEGFQAGCDFTCKQYKKGK